MVTGGRHRSSTELGTSSADLADDLDVLIELTGTLTPATRCRWSIPAQREAPQSWARMSWM